MLSLIVASSGGHGHGERCKDNPHYYVDENRQDYTEPEPVNITKEPTEE